MKTFPPNGKFAGSKTAEHVRETESEKHLRHKV